MKQVILRFCRGYLYVRLTGYSPERFLNLCMANQIIIWDLRYWDQEYRFYIAADDYRRIRPLVRKAGVHLKIEGRYGLPFFLHRNHKRKLYAAGLMCFFLILFLMSRFIWNISLEGNYHFTDDVLLHYLNTLQIHYGIRKGMIDCDALEEAIRSQYPEILWVSARISGTRLLIKVKENEVIGIVPEKNQEARDLVSEYSGIVTNILVRQGVGAVKRGDSVERGQLLVSGRIPIYNDSGEEIGVRYVHADADIILRMPWQYQERIPRLVTEESFTGTERRGFRFRIWNHSFSFRPLINKDSVWKVTGTAHQAVILGDFYLPIWFDQIAARECCIYQRFYTQNEMEALKKQINDMYIQNLMQKGVQIIENNVRILDKSTFWEVQGDFVLEVPAGVGQNMKQEEEPEQLDERN